MKDKTHIRGHVRAAVLGPDGRPKRRDDLSLPMVFKLIVRWLRRYVSFRELGEMFRYQVAVNHNIVTNEGDALIADLLADSPARTKVDNSNGEIGVGIGFSSEAKTVDALVTSTGSPEAMDATYPKVKGSFGAADDNVTQYRSTFEAGDLNASGIDEALLGNGTDTLAYAEISPAVNVGSSDTLQVDWELTILGS
jgi:hypothetical protein